MYNSVIILAGGFGTRLKGISNGIPKALMPIGSRAYLDLLLDKVFQYKISNVYLSLHYKPDMFIEYINHSLYRDKLFYFIEPKPLGTGGAINYVIENSDISSPFFVINGDSLSDINLDNMYIDFKNNHFQVQIGISKIDNAKRYGSVIENKGKIIAFKEKGLDRTGWINNGYYIFNKDVFKGLNGCFSLEKSLFPKLVHNKKIGSFKVIQDNFIDIGLPSDYKRLVKIYEGIY